MRKLLLKIHSFFCTFFSRLVLGKRAGKGLRVNGYSKFTKHTYLGVSCNFNGVHVYGAGEVRIGRYFHSGRGLRILTENHNYKGNKIPYDETYIRKTTTIGDFVWIGMDVLLLPGVTIGDGAIIQAGSVVSSDIPPFSIAGGNPASPFQTRDREAYQEALREERFF